MKSALLGSLLGVCVSFGMAAELDAEKEKSPAWQTDYQRAKEIARETGKPIFLVFR